MLFDIDPNAILKQAEGRFDRRHGVGPVDWPHFDLLWLHGGGVQLRIGASAKQVTLVAPSGILIAPNTRFEGAAISGAAQASICHFTATGEMEEFRTAPPPDAPHLQAMVQRSLTLARRGTAMDRRLVLLRAILDGFHGDAASAGLPQSRVSLAWNMAAGRLDTMRGLPDVAALVDLSESGFRALHRKEFGTPAGRHLTSLRIRAAETMLATTGQTLAEIARAVGFADAASFSQAFSRFHKMTPGAYRRQSGLFA